MGEVVNARAGGERIIIETFDREFAHLDSRSRRILEATPAALLYINQQTTATPAGSSVGESLIRAAGVVEQTFGGLTASLWDNPFEWTLPETLSNVNRILEYLSEVEETRKRAFSTFLTDADLRKEISFPAGNLEPLIHLLLTTLVRAADYQGQALATLKSHSTPSAPGFII
ncbi:MAG TPA: hypothetical protein VJ124_00450 [Pyrinomonadaceae bacterium]|nr:hypothetical protein [Pyrinomonadaceae bacterium]